jgi:hypothetical protein
LKDWPILTSHGVVRADISFEKKTDGVDLEIKVKQGGSIPKLSVQLPGAKGPIWKRQNNVELAKFASSL